MEFTSLNNSGLDLSRGQLAELFQPFVAESFDPAAAPWRAELRRRQSKIRRKYLKRMVLGWLPSTQRNERTVIDEYSKAWQLSEYDKYALNQPLVRVSPWEWGEQKLFASDNFVTAGVQVSVPLYTGGAIGAGAAATERHRCSNHEAKVVPATRVVHLVDAHRLGEGRG